MTQRKKVQLEYVQVDVDFFDKPKIKAVLFEGGPAAIAYLLRLYTALGRATDARLTELQALALSIDVAICREDASRFLKLFLDQEVLSLANGIVTLARIAENQEKLAHQRELWRLQKNGGVPSTEIPPQVPGPSPSASSEIPRGNETEGKPESTEILNTQHLTLKTQDSNSGKGGPGENPSAEDPILELAMTFLEEPNGQPWVNTNAHALAGKRPVKRFPTLFFTGFELASILREYREDNIPDKHIQKAFELCASQKLTNQQKGMRDTSDAVAMRGWVKQTVVEGLIKESRLQKVG